MLCFSVAASSLFLSSLPILVFITHTHKYNFPSSHVLHEKFDENKTQYNDYFINVIKNFGGHLFMNCEAGSLHPHRARLDEAGFTTCFNDYHDLMVAARLGKDGYIQQIAGYQTHLCVIPSHFSFHHPHA